MDLRLKGKTAVITGGSKGIGYAVAEGLAQEGVDLFILARNVEDLNEAARKLEEKYDVNCMGIKSDVTRLEDLKNAETIIKENTETVDILINNAGYGSFGAVEEVPLEEVKRQFEVNLFGLSELTKLIIPGMRENNYGKIITEYNHYYIDSCYHKIKVSKKYQKWNHIRRINYRDKSIISKIISFLKR